MSETITVQIEQQPNTQRVMIPLDVPQSIYDANALELYATNLCEWNAESGITALEAAAQRIRGWVKEEYKALVAEQSAEEARLAALAQYEQAFGG